MNCKKYFKTSLLFILVAANGIYGMQVEEKPHNQDVRSCLESIVTTYGKKCFKKKGLQFPSGLEKCIFDYCIDAQPEWHSVTSDKIPGRVCENFLLANGDKVWYAAGARIYEQSLNVPYEVKERVYFPNRSLMCLQSYETPEGQLALCGAREGGFVALSHLSRPSSVTSIIKHGNSVNAVDFDSINGKIFTGSDDKKACIWQCKAEDGSFLSSPILLSSLPHDGMVWRVVLSPDRAWLATAAIDGKARVFDVNSGKLLCSVQHGHDNVCFAFFVKDNQSLLSASDDGSVRVTKIKTNKEEACLQLAGKIYNVQVSEDKTVAAIASSKGEIRVWDFVNDKILFSDDIGNHGSVGDLSLNKQKSLLAVSAGVSVMIWNLMNNAFMQSWIYEEGGIVSFCLLNSDGNKLATVLYNEGNSTIMLDQQYNEHQVGLRKLLFLWLRVKKMDSNITPEMYLTDICNNLKLNQKLLLQSWESFGNEGQDEIWSKIMKIMKSSYSNNKRKHEVIW